VLAVTTQAVETSDPVAGRVPCAACRPDAPCERHCGARLRQTPGGLCKRAKGQGTDHVGIGRCDRHGGSTENHRASAQRTKGERLVAQFALPTEIHYGQALLENLWRWTGMVNYLGSKIAGFDSDEELKQLSIGAGREKFERPAVWVEMYQTALREQRVSAKACADVGIDERLTQMVERQGQALNAVIRALAAGIFAGLAARGMDGEELRRFEAEQLPQVVRAAVMTIRPPGELQRGA
jgi:hypothetical protein